MLAFDTIRTLDNIGFRSDRRSFPGFTKSDTPRTVTLPPRAATRVDFETGDLLSLSSPAGGNGLKLLAFGPTGETALQMLGLSETARIGAYAFDSRPLAGWVAAMGGEAANAWACAAIAPSDEAIVVQSSAACTVWVVNVEPAETLVSGEALGPVVMSHQPARPSSLRLPPPLGDVKDEFTVSRATARAYELAAGDLVQIIDVDGQQCSDFMAFRSDGLERGRELLIDGTATRSMVRRSYPGPGLFDKFFDQDMRPLLNVVQDTCGRHDTFGLACTSRGYEDRGFPGHINCSDNMSYALAPFGVARRVAWPAINFFWNTWVDPSSHHILTEESHSRPGDYVIMRAMDNLVCVSTACPDDIDPINGWNPTDIHVRIYRPHSLIRRAVAYREKEDAPMSVSQESAFHPRTSVLTEHFAPARDLWAPVSYPAVGTLAEYWACRDAVTVQDMSGLRKYDIVGPDAERLLQRAMTRDISRLAIWRGTYTLMCDDTGAVIDDGTLFRMGDSLFRWCCGSEESARVLDELARELGLQVRINAMGGALPNLALQGPRSRDLLRKIVFTQPHVPGLDQIKWFGATIARLGDREGAPFMLTRSGYTGELGYELFCAGGDAVAIWDAVMEAGAEFGIQPMGSAALETIRIEAGLAAAGREFAPGVDAFEAGLGFAVDLRKTEFTGKAALERNAEEPRRVLKGLRFEGDDVPHHGAPVLLGERQVGVVTSATRSPTLQCAIAMARLAVEHSANGTSLEVGQMDGRMKRLPASVTDIPFIDPQRKRARA
ncbi:DUF1989 domain-containing protein [Tropicimonas sediminicola]|uniref:Aminomethyltransferase n=1 Tax=Tropicimonas sediminicola TaxID=1031541 RepID=A0A239L914_9RHOB|nr:aminomethyltransferase family protein [Tropicimonas sediminicola]SNT26398.1 aminomethyltransferase [Tropicimonas sediminicola]